MATTILTGTRVKRDNRGTQGVWAFTNFTENLSINCDGASNDQLSDALATLVKMLIEQGVLKGTIATA
jgi:hypothetical protein